MNTLYLIPARRGSKGIPKKNIRPFAGKPLICYTIECALKIAKPSEICISTDDTAVIEIAIQYGLSIPFIRPSELSGDKSSQYDVIRHAIEYYDAKNLHFDCVVLLQPTSPFRKPEHIKEALALFNNRIDMVVSVKATDANPYFVLFEENKDGFLIKSKEGNYIRRQDCPEVWQLNGAIYVINTKSLKTHYKFTDFQKIIKYHMDGIHSIDIDTEMDFKFGEFLIHQSLLSD